jgi:hypothetical protein
MSALSPFTPQLRTLVGAAGTAASCQEGTFGTVPRDAAIIMQTRLVARGIDGWVHNSVQTPCITDKVVLPSFQHRQGTDGYLWLRWR